MDKIKSSICFSCCFRSTDADPLAPDYHQHPSARTTSAWLRSKAGEIPEMKDKCRGFISKIGKHHHHHHHRRQHGDFRYDPLSYALNFDEGVDFVDDGRVEISPSEYKYRNFSSRLPASPPPPPALPSSEVICS